MKNHYRMLQNVRSTIDNSVPQSLLMKTHSACRLEKYINAQLKTNQERKQRSPRTAKKHSCMSAVSTPTYGTRSDPQISAVTGPTRTAKKILPYEMPKRSDKTHSKFIGRDLPQKNVIANRILASNKLRHFDEVARSLPTSERNSRVKSIDIPTLDLTENKPVGDFFNISPKTPREVIRHKIDSENQRTSSATKTFLKESTEEHEYLLFLLRITEDIISKDYYTNTDIKTVFQNHIEANRGHLDVQKMEHHISRLSKELNIIDQTNISVSNDDAEIYYNSSFLEANSSHSLLNVDTNTNQKSCECGTLRRPPLYSFSVPDDYLTSNLIYGLHKTSEEINVSKSNNLGNENFQETLKELRNIISEKDIDEKASSDSNEKICAINNGAINSINKTSLSRLTECTEPSTSFNTLGTTPKLKSFSTISSFGNLDAIFPHFENSEGTKMGSSTTLKPFKDDNANNTSEMELNHVQHTNSLENVKIFEKVPEERADQVMLETIDSIMTENVKIGKVDDEDNSGILKENINLVNLSNEESNISREASEMWLNKEIVPSIETHTSSSEIIEKSVKSQNSFNTLGERHSYLELPHNLNTSPPEEVFPEDVNAAQIIFIHHGNLSNTNVEHLQNSEKYYQISRLESEQQVHNPEDEITNSAGLKQGDIKINDNGFNLVQNFKNSLKTEQIENNNLVIKPIDSKIDHLSKIHILENEICEKSPKISTKNIAADDQNTSNLNVKITDSLTSPLIKVIFNGKITDDQYMFIQGPVYVLRALIETDPKLVVCAVDKENVGSDVGQANIEESGVDSGPESLNSNATYTVSVEPELDVEPCPPKRENPSLESIFRASSRDLDYSNVSKKSIVDSSKLLNNSDYDLTPQRDNNSYNLSDNTGEKNQHCTNDKYHFLMVDASTSVSNMNINNTFQNEQNFSLNPGNFGNIQNNLLINSDKYVLDRNAVEAGDVNSTEEPEEVLIKDGTLQIVLGGNTENMESYIKLQKGFSESDYINIKHINQSRCLKNLSTSSKLLQKYPAFNLTGSFRIPQEPVCNDECLTESESLGEVGVVGKFRKHQKIQNMTHDNTETQEETMSSQCSEGESNKHLSKKLRVFSAPKSIHSRKNQAENSEN